MKRLSSFVLLISSFVILAAWWLGTPENRSDRSDQTDPSDHTATIQDKAAIFQKAFWKRPSTEDHILHAERREWSDHNGLSKWQWFISLKPSPAIVDYLITQNAFSLTAAPRSGGRQHAEAPEWFPAEAPQTFTNSTGTFTLLWDPKANLLHATDRGSGFRPGAPEPARAITATQPQGRLPLTPPPRP
jgi:hypothetical protein